MSDRFFNELKDETSLDFAQAVFNIVIKSSSLIQELGDFQNSDIDLSVAVDPNKAAFAAYSPPISAQSAHASILVGIQTISNASKQAPDLATAGIIGTSNAATDFVGTIAHELGHFEDKDYQRFLQTQGIHAENPENDLLYVIYGLTGEGKAHFSNVAAYAQIEQATRTLDNATLINQDDGSSSDKLKSDYDAVAYADTNESGVARATEIYAHLQPSSEGSSLARNYIQYYQNGWLSNASAAGTGPTMALSQLSEATQIRMSNQPANPRVARQPS